MSKKEINIEPLSNEYLFSRRCEAQRKYSESFKRLADHVNIIKSKANTHILVEGEWLGPFNLG